MSCGSPNKSCFWLVTFDTFGTFALAKHLPTEL
jgi:hypothetical protein